MKEYDRAKPLISIHVPKCGGRSFAASLREWFRGRFYEHYFDVINHRMPTKYELAPGVCIHGHFNRTKGFGVKDYYPEVDQFITILRDPFEIALSNYFYIKRQEKRRWLRQYRIKIKGIWRISNKYRWIDNYLSNFWFTLLDQIPYDWIQKVSGERGQYASIEHYLKHQKSHMLDYMPYEMTLDNFEELFEKYFVYVGVVEDLQTSVDVIATKLGYNSPQVVHQNVSKRDEVVPPSVREQFLADHQIEYAVYNYALSNYKKMNEVNVIP